RCQFHRQAGELRSTGARRIHDQALPPTVRRGVAGLGSIRRRRRPPRALQGRRCRRERGLAPNVEARYRVQGAARLDDGCQEVNVGRWARVPAVITVLAWSSSLAAQQPSRELVVRVLDVGQGDATLIENGGSRVLIDGGPDTTLHLTHSTINVIVHSLSHADPQVGMRELYDSNRNIRIHYFIEDQDPNTAAN